MNIRDLLIGAVTSGVLFFFVSLSFCATPKRLPPTGCPTQRPEGTPEEGNSEDPILVEDVFTGEQKLVLLWTPLKGSADNWQEYLGQGLSNAEHCNFAHAKEIPVITSDRSKLSESTVVIFSLNDLKLDEYEDSSAWQVDNLPLLDRAEHQIWALLWREPPPQIKASPDKFRWLDDLFNWTISYRRDSDIFFPFGYIVDIPHQKEYTMAYRSIWKRKGLVRHANNCQGSSRAEEFAQNLTRFDIVNLPVVLAGRCHTEVGGTNKSTWNRAEVPLGQSPINYFKDSLKFWMAFEAEICDDYITEDFYRALHHSYVPLVFGGTDIGYDEVVLPGTYIDVLAFSDQQELMDYLHELSRLPVEFDQYIAWQHDFQVLPQYRWVCDLARASNSIGPESDLAKPAIPNFQAFWDQKKCYGDYKQALNHSMRAYFQSHAHFS